MAKKLIHLTAILPGLKTAAKSGVSDLYHLLKKEKAFDGFSRVYKPYAENAGKPDLIPPKEERVKQKVRNILAKLVALQGKLFDTVFQQDVGNQKAVANVEINGKVIKENVPICNLLYMHDRLVELRAEWDAIPTPDLAVVWVFDKASDLLRSEKPTSLQRTAKVPQRFEKAPATDRHPAQVEMLFVDTPIGEYEETLFSGAERADIKAAMLTRIDDMIAAFKLATETANANVKVEDDSIAKPVFDYILQPLTDAYGPLPSVS